MVDSYCFLIDSICCCFRSLLKLGYFFGDLERLAFGLEFMVLKQYLTDFRLVFNQLWPGKILSFFRHFL